MTTLNKTYEKRRNFDLRRSLSGVERLIDHLLDFYEKEPAFTFGAVQFLPLQSSVRDNIGSAIIQACSKIKVHLMEFVFKIIITNYSFSECSIWNSASQRPVHNNSTHEKIFYSSVRSSSYSESGACVRESESCRKLDTSLPTALQRRWLPLQSCLLSRRRLPSMPAVANNRSRCVFRIERSKAAHCREAAAWQLS